MNMQNVKDLSITEGDVRTIHDSSGNLLWGRLAYDTKYAGDTEQDGTPSPDTPVPIQVVTGEQTVTISDGVNSHDYTVNLGSIELAKIGTYEDYIYKSGDDWYVHKATTSNYLVGDTIGMSISKQSGTGRFNIILPTRWESYKKLAGSTTFSKCNSYIVVAQGTTNGNFDTNASSYNYALNFNSSTGNALRIKNIDLSTVEDMEDSMTATPLVLYYVLATPTDTQITDTTLIGQLDAIHEWLTRYGYNSTVSGNLPLLIEQTNLS